MPLMYCAGMGTVKKHTPDYVQARDESRHPRPQLQSGPSDLVQNFLLSRKGQAHQGKSVREVIQFQKPSKWKFFWF